MPEPNLSWIEESYDEYPRVEAAFQAALDESLNPRGPDFLYELVAGLGLPPGARVLDLGCGEGRHSIQLAARFGFAVQGVEPVTRQIELARESLAEAAKHDPGLSGLVRFVPGTAEALPIADSSVNLIWCKEVLVLVDGIDAAFAECRRVLRNGGRMLIYQVFPTDRLEPREAEWFWTTARGAHQRTFEAAFAAAGLVAEQQIELTSEGGEHGQEERGEPGRRLLHAARLLRDPERYIAQFGETAYNIMLGDCFWHIYRMIGKLTARVYLLRKLEQ